ncbi:gliding motility protein GldM [Winogradskyella maritima]|uniref:Gliding motility protein GldM n=1 Tax=Winogradskyella maritima TaxID=1517766 RepID=A0ABV8AG03_9FLAO|nr:gliding motility protein GldM [Winogradskyella maritima]
MAGGKANARQKMINLMYLVFIAMMAMNMSKEVLTAFGLMEAKFENNNEAAAENNAGMLANLETKATEKPEEFKEAAAKANQITAVSDRFFAYIETLKNDLLREGKYEIDPETGKLPFEAMDKTDILDEAWFTGDRLTKKGDEVMATIEKYKSDIKTILGNDVKYQSAIEDFEDRFDTTPVVNNDGKEIDWLDYHYQGFPAIASYTKLTAMQNDVKLTETNMFNLFLGNTLDEAVSLKNYTAIVIPDKNAFFAGEKFTGRVVLGKYANVTPTALSVEGNNIDLSRAEAIDSTGAARIEFVVGNVGEHDVNGQFTFKEDGKDLPIDFNGKYVVVPRPNSATISADKMNVVYRGVTNPMTISFAGVSDNKVSASAPGLNKTGTGKYEMRPQSGREVKINVSATLDDGSRVSDSKVFRIKDLPKPLGSFNGQQGNAKLPRNNVEIGKLSADFGDDFDFKLPLDIISFTIKVPGKPSVNVNGNRLNSQAKNALRSAKRGDLVQFINIKAKAQGSSIRIKTVTPVVIELAN